MSHMLRILAAVAVVCLGGPTPAQGEDTGIHHLKRDMVEAALNGADAVNARSALEGSIARARALVAAEVDSTVAEPFIDLTLTGAIVAAPRYGDGLVTVDLYDTIVIPDVKTMVLDGGNTIAGVKTYLAQVDPQFVTRLEIQLSGPAACRVAAAGDRVKIFLSPTDPTTAKAQTLLAELKAQPAAAAATLAEIRARADELAREWQQGLGASIAALSYQLERAKLGTLEQQLVSVASNRNSAANPAEFDLALHASRISDLSNRYAKVVGAHQQARKDLAGILATLEREHGRIAVELKQQLATENGVARLHAANKATRTAIADMVQQAVASESKLQGDLQALHEQVRATALTLDAFVLNANAAAGAVQGPALEQLQSQLDALRSAPSTQRKDRVAAFTEALERVKLDAPKFTVDTNHVMAALADPEAEQGVQEAQDLEGGEATESSQPAETPPPPARRESPPLPDPTIPVAPVTVIQLSDDAAAEAEAEGNVVLAQDPSAEAVADVMAKPEMSGSQGRTFGSLAPSPGFNLYNPNLPADQDPLRQLVNLDFVDMDLSTVVGLLARKAGINVIANENVQGTVTVSLQNIPLGKAIETVLRLSNLGIIEEDGVYRITSYEEAVASRRETKMIPLKNASADEIRQTLNDVITGTAGASLMSIGANETTNIVILSGPSELVREFEQVVYELDVAEQVIPTITQAIKLNYAEPEELIAIVQPLLSPEAGRVSSDLRGRHLIVTDLPVKVEEIQALVLELDLPVKQVNISTMIIDALVSDDAETGVDWVTSLIRRTDSDGNVVSDLAALNARSDFTTGPITPGVPGINLGSQVIFGILTGDFDITAAIAAEVRSNNAQLLANPTIVTVENKPARIAIAEEIPFQELTQSLTGPPIATTEFKEVGTVLSVTPRVTHDNHILIDIDAKQSDLKGESVTGVPPEDKREAQTTLRLADGQTAYIGGLRRFDDDLSVRKTPILGDIPVLNLLFRNQSVIKESIELLIFLTCHVLPDEVPDLTPSQKEKFDLLGATGPEDVDGTRALVRNYVHPEDQRDPFWKWRRAK